MSGSITGNLGLALGSLLLFGITCEGVARLVDLRPDPGRSAIPFWVEEQQLRREAPLITLLARNRALSRYFELYQWDRHLFYRVRPNLELAMLDYGAPASARERTRWTVRTNAHGFRDRSFAVPKPPGRVRVLALGDSSTFGWGVDADVSYVKVAERRLQEGRPSLDLELLNLGVPGYSSFQGRVLLERVALSLEPDALLFSFGSNDRTRTGQRDRDLYARRASPLGALQSLARRSRAYESAVAWVSRWRERPPPEERAEGWRLQREGPVNVSIEELAENLDAAAALARQRGLRFALVSNCLDLRGLAVLGAAARRSGVPFVNGHEVMTRRTPELRRGLHAEEVERLRTTYGVRALEAPDSTLWTLLPDRCHPNRVGHRFIGEAVAEVVERWLP